MRECRITGSRVLSGDWNAKPGSGHTVPALPFLGLAACASLGLRTVFSTQTPGTRSIDLPAVFLIKDLYHRLISQSALS